MHARPAFRRIFHLLLDRLRVRLPAIAFRGLGCCEPYSSSIWQVRLLRSIEGARQETWLVSGWSDHSVLWTPPTSFTFAAIPSLSRYCAGTEPDPSTNPVGYAKFYSRSHDTVIRVYDGLATGRKVLGYNYAL